MRNQKYDKKVHTLANISVSYEKTFDNGAKLARLVARRIAIGSSLVKFAPKN